MLEDVVHRPIGVPHQERVRVVRACGPMCL
jgi:hypothetical protein